MGIQRKKGNSFGNVIPLVCLTVVSCEFFSSVHEVTKLADYERLLLGKMEKFVSLNENKLDYLKEKLSELEREREEALEAGHEYFENPINKYLLTKRLSLDWERMENLLDHEVGTNVMKSIDRFQANWTFPGEEDYNGAMEGLLRLQRIYRLVTKDVANGILGGVKYTTDLSAKDCFHLGRFALKQGYLLAAHAWLSEALERFDSYIPSAFDELFEKPDILEPLAEVKFKLSDYKAAAELSYSLHLWRPYDARVMQLRDYYTQEAQVRNSIAITSEHEPIPDDLDDIDQHASYRFTCSGHIHQLPSDERDLRCMYLSHIHPFLLLAPIKLEELNFDPVLLLYHDVIYDSEIEKILELANNKMRRSTVASTNGSVVSNVRTSQVSFAKKTDHKVFQTIDERVAHMTGMNMYSSENPQVANYGIGGHYSIHKDFFDKLTLPRLSKGLGNRISTVLFYLTDVEQGGGTAFPYMKRLVKPKKGAAAYWYNLHASGDGDMWTKHGACPVLVGSKWVLNRWIREKGQDIVRPCNLYSDAVDNSMMF